MLDRAIYALKLEARYDLHQLINLASADELFKTTSSNTINVENLESSEAGLALTEITLTEYPLSGG